MTRSLALVGDWPVDHVAAVVCAGPRRLDTVGQTDRPFRLASISKPLVAWAILVAVEEGIVELDEPYEPSDPTRTLRHLLAHASGYGFESAAPIVAAERKRIYSNTGIERAADIVEQAADMPFAEYLREAVFLPLHMTKSHLDGSPAHQVWSTAEDLATFATELAAPVLVTPGTAADAVRPHYPTLGGIVPGVGRFETSPWGLGFEIRGEKQPHWTGAHNSAATYGHFGGAGTMMWTDPHALSGGAPITLIALTDRRFDEWAETALRVWPELSDAVLSEFADPAPDAASPAGSVGA